MLLEIERKFLVNGDFKSFAIHSTRIVQAYISSNPERTVRIRLTGNKAYITIKGEPDESGISRFEWEKEIPTDEAEQLLQVCEPGFIDKVRYYVPAVSNKMFEKVFEVDEFHGENEGLIVAEIELNNSAEDFDKPEWLGQEVTGDKRYYNSQLLKHPYSAWEKEK
ncbi:adenylate cyclase [Dysgonomonas sp. PH5-45]|uniref:CYTH domain-containing protein n=1 Tax=unclassified Dysgonomonas TaxID=2630389 RepID=UPI002476029E|nr:MULTISPECIES: CYTH domain-containing protein [unclassified Dysgonomonas]MDH6355962.1 adenylate cyclase [Dysgonomonas sp. PH5-45]MDH6388857.1 adenylate cyclase [Dysgonomonas sp. PH5-37]